MEPIAVDLVLLRATAPDLPLIVGRVLSARVVERRGRFGILSLAGAILTAELPEEIAVGERLQLAVRELTRERVVLARVDRRRERSAPRDEASPDDGRDDADGGESLDVYA